LELEYCNSNDKSNTVSLVNSEAVKGLTTTTSLSLFLSSCNTVFKEREAYYAFDNCDSARQVLVVADLISRGEALASSFSKRICDYKTCNKFHVIRSEYD
jgi:hypothetical protein